MAERYALEILVSGDKFDVENVSLQQVGTFLTSIEQAITPIVIRDNPSLILEEGDVIVSLVSISKGSLRNILETKYESEVSKAVELTADAVISENYGNLPVKTIDALKEIIRFNRKHNSHTEIWQANGSRVRLATITQTTRIRVDNFITRGTTTLYGTLMRIGGDNPPRAWIRFIDGTTLSCRIQNISLAKRMSPLLYQRIGVRGIAQWDTRDMSLYEFRIEELSPYRQKSVRESFDRLREVAGHYFDESDDFDIADLRGKDENE